MDLPAPEPQQAYVAFDVYVGSPEVILTPKLLHRSNASTSPKPVSYSQLVQKTVKAYTDSRSANTSEEKMGDLTRNEIDAKLGRNKAEVSSIAAEMRKEMADWKTSQTQIMMKMQSEISAINVKLDERFEAQKRATALIQWLVGVILAIVALVPAFQGMVGKSSNSQQPIVIQVPQQQSQK